MTFHLSSVPAGAPPPPVVLTAYCFTGPNTENDFILGSLAPSSTSSRHELKKNKVDSDFEIYLVLPIHKHLLYCTTSTSDFPDSSDGIESVCNVGDPSSIPGLGRDAREGIGYSLQYSGLENSMECTVQVAEKSRARLRDFHSFTH